MYSLYRAWLMREPSTASAPPDVWLEVGPPPTTRFAAHAALLGAHSGYLRAALSSMVPVPSTEPSAQRHLLTIDSANPEHYRTESNQTEPADPGYNFLQYKDPIFIPNITSDQFAPLLTYMYTGFLDLNLENIFAILLATHVLHMPRALEICRAFLTQNQNSNIIDNQERSAFRIGNVIKPIPSRKIMYGYGIPQTLPPLYHSLFQSSQNTPFRSLENEKTVPNPPEEQSEPIIDKNYDDPVASTSQIQSNKKETITKSKTDKLKTRRLDNVTKKHKISTKNKSPSTLTSEIKKVAKTIIANDSEKVIIDIACCDGPVRFRRVLNNAYGVCNSATSSVTKVHNQLAIGTSFNEQMAQNIRNYNEDQNLSDDSEEINIEDVNTSEKSLNLDKTENNSTSSETIYTCVYCKHTFKSQYCYQKHARRHIHPVEMNNGAGNTNEVKKIEPSKEKIEKIIDSKREVRPLDMNVQYYPCKTCGSKFPSYYFVHKHRKLCHADEVA